jgi:recombination protein RecA
VGQNIISKTGSWYSFGADKIGQGRENAKLFLESNPDIFSQVEGKLKAILFPSAAEEKSAAKAPEPAEKTEPEAADRKPAEAAKTGNG